MWNFILELGSVHLNWAWCFPEMFSIEAFMPKPLICLCKFIPILGRTIECIYYWRWRSYEIFICQNNIVIKNIILLSQCLGLKCFFTCNMELFTHIHSCVLTWKHTFFGEQYIILMPQVHGMCPDICLLEDLNWCITLLLREIKDYWELIFRFI